MCDNSAITYNIRYNTNIIKISLIYYYVITLILLRYNTNILKISLIYYYVITLILLRYNTTTNIITL
jgi:hypothetical protein